MARRNDLFTVFHHPIGNHSTNDYDDVLNAKPVYGWWPVLPSLYGRARTRGLPNDYQGRGESGEGSLGYLAVRPCRNKAG